MKVDPAITALLGRTAATARPPSVRYPSWMDARYLLTAAKSDLAYTLVLGAGGRAVIPGNAQRFGLGIINGSSAPDPVLASPFGDPLLAPFAYVLQPSPRWYDLFTYGPLVAYQWTVYCAGATTVYVVESALN